jgi:DNA-binding CsgD family transcriptional regulator
MSDTETVTRVPLRRPLTKMEKTVVSLIGPGYTYDQAAEALGLAPRTVRMHCENAILKIPGTVPCLTRIVLWWQGYPIAALFSYAHGRRVGPSNRRTEERPGAECRRKDDADVAPSKSPRKG